MNKTPSESGPSLPLTVAQMSPEQLHFFSIFFPHTAAAYKHLLSRQTPARFVQYTTAEAAIKILRTRMVWMRKTLWMNDYREIEYGWDGLLKAYRDTSAGKQFQAAVDSVHAGLSKAITDNFDPWINEYRLNTYVTSISEHEDSEDVNGRLSMWRAYGSGTGVALVIKSLPFTMLSDGLGALSSPVAYLAPNEIEAQLGNIASSVTANLDFLKNVPKDRIIATVHEAFRFGMICCKHPGFAEEREWRIVYNPKRDTKKILTSSIEIINSVPQPVYSIPLKPIEGYTDLSPPAIIDRVIIGPARFAGALLEAFWAELEKAGVPDARSRVVLSDIPLRT